MLGEAGATVYCTGRSVAGHPPAAEPTPAGPRRSRRPPRMVTAHGGAGIAIRVDHDDATRRRGFRWRVSHATRATSTCSSSISGATTLPVPFGTPFWSIPIEAGRRTIERTLWPHVQTLQALTPLLIDRPRRRSAATRGGVRCRRPGALLPHEPLLRPRRHAADSARLCRRGGARAARHHGRSPCRRAMSGPSSRSSASA